MSLPDDPLFHCLRENTCGLHAQLGALGTHVRALLAPLGFHPQGEADQDVRLRVEEHGGAAVLRWEERMRFPDTGPEGNGVLRVRLLAMGPFGNAVLRGKGYLHVELQPGEPSDSTFLPGRESLWFQKELFKFTGCPDMSDADLALHDLVREAAAAQRLGKWYSDGIERARLALAAQTFERDVHEALAL